jgi:hypothetical protein
MSTSQLSFDLPAPPATGEMPLVPARMVNEYVYCPRLDWLELTESGRSRAIPRRATADPVCCDVLRATALKGVLHLYPCKSILAVDTIRASDE